MNKENRKELLEEEDGDVTIIVGEEVNQIPKSFKAHSLILKTQCPWFKIALSKDWARKGEETIVIRKPNISTSTFEIILKYLYCGIISTSHTGKQILDILIAADELNLNEIFKHLQDTLLKSHYEWLQNNFFYVYDIILKHQEFKILQEYFQEIIDDKPDILFYSQDFVKMDKELLINLLKRDNLVMSEIDVWRKLIEWGIENSKISKPLISNWDVEDFVKLKTILDQCITSIRFNNISSNDFYFEVRPYEKILSEQMKEDLIRYHMTSSSEYDYKNAIRYSSNGFTGPVFGDGDLVMTGENFKTDKSCYCKKASYQESIMDSTEKFSVDEYEVFELVKKPEPIIAATPIPSFGSPFAFPATTHPSFGGFGGFGR
ncbi:hypothetical protein RhiirA5_373798 [Rhizophagus irregularis]|uniref:BTB domain-containing protein n=1 Tax=Rhizophagus irregularis TaxID=588596 RepID=A0A2N0PXI3_9GLOM|nr:hypothetical protein RhiirA5_373798 [Rhizophagus irregularis]